MKLLRGGLLMWKPNLFRDNLKPAASAPMSAEEYQQILEHVERCAFCHSEHPEFLSFLEQLPESELDSIKDDVARHVEMGGLKERFIESAIAAGIQFSESHLSRRHPEPSPLLSYRWLAAAALVAVILIAVVRRPAQRVATASPSAKAQVPARGKLRVQDQENHVWESKLLALQSALDASKKEISDLQGANSGMLSATAAMGKDLVGKRAEIQALQQSLNRLRDTNAQQARQSETAEELLAHTQSELEDVRSRGRELETEAAADKMEVGTLSQQLNAKGATIAHQRELLAEGRDITDLMGARNLHIIDVRDADGKGKNKKSFGRIFYTEGKSLIFYAYDLDAGKGARPNSSFEVWGERLGEPTSVRSLGILYTDNKDKARWALTVDDPQQLAEIDSLFVTLEPHHGASSPRGGKILFAFLGGRANHP